MHTNKCLFFVLCLFSFFVISDSVLANGGPRRQSAFFYQDKGSLVAAFEYAYDWAGLHFYTKYWTILQDGNKSNKPIDDEIQECFNLKNNYKNDSTLRTILRSRSKVANNKVVVSYTSQELSGNDLLLGAGRFTCYLDEKGKVKDNRNLCLNDHDTIVGEKINTTIEQLLTNYPWARESLERKLGGLETLKIFADLNDDGIPELTDSGSDWCGAMNCFYPLIYLDIANRRISEIDDGLDSNDLNSVLNQTVNGWKMLRKITCGMQCSCSLKEFNKNKEHYQIREEYSGFDFWEVHEGKE